MLPFQRRNCIVFLIILSLGIIFLFPDLLSFRPVCLFYTLTGVPCPGCGMLRANEALLEGDILSALYLNPLVIPLDLLLAVYIVWLFIDILSGKDRVNIFLKKKWNRKIFISVILVILANWLFNLYKYLYL